MAKVNKPFEFKFPLKHKIVRDLKLVTEQVGDLTIEGYATLHPSESVLNIYDRYEVDIDFIKWNGVDIKPVLDVVADGTVADIHEACVRHAAELFNEKAKEVA